VKESLNGPKEDREANKANIKLGLEVKSGIIKRKSPFESLYQMSSRGIKIMLNNSIRMNFIRNEHTLDSNGFVIRVLKNKDKGYGLTQPFSEQPAHKIAFLKYFLFYDGATLISLLKKIFHEIKIEAHTFAPSNPEEDKGEWNDVISKMFEEYENLTINREDKIRYKTIKKNSRKIQYSYEYVRQLFSPRAGALADFGIIDYDDSMTDGRKKLTYYNKIDTEEVTKRFLDIFPSVESLDESFSNDGDFFERISKFYNFSNSRKIDLTSDIDFLQEHVLSAYEIVSPMNKGIVPLNTIRDIVCIKCLLGIKPSESDLSLKDDEKIICEISDVNEAIEKLILNKPSAEVLNDRKGRPTYLSLN